jgi:hypothetical protein
LELPVGSATGSALRTAPPSARLFASAAILLVQHAQAFDTCSAALPATTSSATITPSRPAEVAEEAARAPLTWQLKLFCDPTGAAVPAGQAVHAGKMPVESMYVFAGHRQPPSDAVSIVSVVAPGGQALQLLEVL